MTNKLFTTALLFVLYIAASAQNTYYPSFSAGSYLTYIPNHEGIRDNLVKSPTYPTYFISTTFNTRPGGPNEQYMQMYNYPVFGIGISLADLPMLDFHNNSKLRSIYSIYLMTEYSVFKREKMSLGVVGNYGIGITTGDYYDPIFNKANIYLSWPFTVYVGIGPQVKIRPTEHLELGINTLVWHHSNGNSSIPNKGLNEMALGGFIRYNIDEPYTGRYELPHKPVYPKGFHWDFYLNGGFHGCKTEWAAYNEMVEDPMKKQKDFKRWPRVGLGIDCIYRYGLLASTGLVFDVIHHSNMDALRASDVAIYGKDYAEANGKYSPLVLCMGFIQEFYINSFSIYAGASAYLLHRVGIKEAELSSPLCQRLGFRYYVSQWANSFLGFCIRSHKFNDADYFEFQLGIRI